MACCRALFHTGEFRRLVSPSEIFCEAHRVLHQHGEGGEGEGGTVAMEKDDEGGLEASETFVSSLLCHVARPHERNSVHSNAK